MAAHYARNAYLQAKVQPETNPKRLILMLYEGALEHLRLTREGIEEHNARKRGEHLSRAVAITHDITVVELAMRYVERLKQIWQHDVMGLPAQVQEVLQ